MRAVCPQHTPDLRPPLLCLCRTCYPWLEIPPREQPTTTLRTSLTSACFHPSLSNAPLSPSLSLSELDWCLHSSLMLSHFSILLDHQHAADVQHSPLMFWLPGLQYVSVNIHIPHCCKEEPCCQVEGTSINLYQLLVCPHNDGHCLKLFEHTVESLLSSLQSASAWPEEVSREITAVFVRD